MLLKWFFGSDVSNPRSESRTSSEEALTALCMLSVAFSRGFPEKGMAWCCVHYSFTKAFACSSLRMAEGLRLGWACSGTRAWAGVAAEAGASHEKPEPSLWARFSLHSLDGGLCLP